MPTPAETADPATLRALLCERLTGLTGRAPDTATAGDWALAVATVARERALARVADAERRARAAGARRVGYLSMEYHVGRLLRSTLQALGLEQAVAEALAPFGIDPQALDAEETDPGLGSGGLGRLAACFLDSLATGDYPATGYGLRYELGLFRQRLDSGHQEEEPDPWLRGGFPWELRRPAEAVRVQFCGRVESTWDGDAERFRYQWVDGEEVLAVPHDVPVVGDGERGAVVLRLWAAEPVDNGLDGEAFRAGDYPRAFGQRAQAAALTTFLYPDDGAPTGQALRLQQQYLLASASLRDVLRRCPPGGEGWCLGDQVVLQLNDTHPVLAVPELLRLLLDEHGLDWDEAWAVTRRTFAYTNHTLLPEALETWPQEMVGWLLPRHLELIHEIDRRLRRDLAAGGVDPEQVARMGIVEGGRVRMANLAMAGSYAVNGVAALHTRLLQEGLLRDWYAVHPERFSNKTNGVTPRRWLRQANPGLSALLDARVDGWARDLERLRALEPAADDADFRAAYRAVKAANKRRLAARLAREAELIVDPDALLDVMIKRFHQYKRQLLVGLWVVHRYLALLDGRLRDPVPRTMLFAGKAAPTYAAAKEVIRLLLAIARTVNGDPRTRDVLRVAFVPNYSVSWAQSIVPAAQVSEQVSTAGYEASGTGNMKLALNGALTLGTLDGANVEIREAVGAENVFTFGLTTEEVAATRAAGYRPGEVAAADPDLVEVLDALKSSVFAPRGFAQVVAGLVDHDPYLVLADFAAYVRAQGEVDDLARQPEAWTRKAVLNTARMGRFSSDRTIAAYAQEIWRVAPLSQR